MRHPILYALTLVAACSGAASVVTPPPAPPPPPPGGATPAVLAVQAGDGQSAEPGAVLSVKPIVVVKDVAGLGVAGVAVTFAVDSGGGSLQSTTATTASDGTAGPGDWHLGSGEGRNVISATAGSLTKVKFVATAAITGVTLSDQSVGSGGGTITVSHPGSAINGMTIVIPAGAFPGAQTIGISYASSAGFAAPSGARVISPLVTFRVSDGGLAAKPMLITIPVTVPAGTFPAILLRDPTSGRQELLTTVNYSSTSVTGMTGHLNASRLMGSDGSFAAVAAGLRDPAAIGTAAVIALPPEMLDADHDTGFRPGTDSWEFLPIGTVINGNTTAAIVATEAWYYLSRRANGSLWKKYREAEGVQQSNRRGLRWTSVAAKDFGGQLVTAGRSILTMLAGIPLPGGLTLAQKVTISSFNSLRSALTISPGAPQMAFLDSGNENDQTAAVLVYRSTGQKLFAVDPGNPGQTVTLDFTSGTMAPVTLAGSPVSYTNIFATGFSLLATASSLQAQWPAVADGTIGNGVFPTFQGRVGWGTAIGESADLKDPFYVFAPGDKYAISYWFDCVTCNGNPRPAGHPVGTATVAPLDAYIGPISGAGPWTGLGAGFRASTALATAGFRQLGAVVLSHRTSGDADLLWTDWVAVKEYRLPASIAPAAPTAGVNVDLTLTVTVDQAPGNLEYEWDFADGLKVVTTTLATTHKWTASGTFTVNVTARDKATKEPVALAKIDVLVGSPIYTAWKTTSMTTAIVNDTRSVDTRSAADGNVWLTFLTDHGPDGIYNFMWNTYRADSTFYYTAQSTNAAIMLVARDTLFGPPFSAGAGALQSIYWWTYGSYPTSASTPFQPGIGSSNNFKRGGTFCSPAYTARFSPASTTTAGRVTGLNWINWIGNSDGTPREPMVMFEYDVTFSGETATGTTTKTYRFIDNCNENNPAVTWSYRTTFTAQRVR